jgi:hypothetical protein
VIISVLCALQQCGVCPCVGLSTGRCSECCQLHDSYPKSETPSFTCTSICVVNCCGRLRSTGPRLSLQQQWILPSNFNPHLCISSVPQCCGLCSCSFCFGCSCSTCRQQQTSNSTLALRGSDRQRRSIRALSYCCPCPPLASGCQCCAITSGLCSPKRYGLCSCVLLCTPTCRDSRTCVLSCNSCQCSVTQQWPLPACPKAFICTFASNGRRVVALIGNSFLADQRLLPVCLFVISVSASDWSCGSIRPSRQQQWPLPSHFHVQLCINCVPQCCGFRSCFSRLICSCSTCRQLQDFNSMYRNPCTLASTSKCRDFCTCTFRGIGCQQCVMVQLLLVFFFAALAPSLALSRSNFSPCSPLLQQWPLLVCPVAFICIFAFNGRKVAASFGCSFSADLQQLSVPPVVALASISDWSCGSTGLRLSLQQQWPLSCPWLIYNSSPLAGLILLCAVWCLLPYLFVSVDAVLCVLDCPWSTYNNPPLTGPILSRAGRRLLPCFLASVDVELRVLVCSCLTYNNSPLGGLIPFRAVLRFLPSPRVSVDVVLCVLVCPWPIYNNPPLVGFIPSRAVRRLLRCLFASFDDALRVLVCPWLIYNNPPLAGLSPSRAVRRLLRCSFVSVDVAFRVLVCPWPIYNNPPLVGFILSCAGRCRLPCLLVFVDVALRVLACPWPIYNNPPLGGLIPSCAVRRLSRCLFVSVDDALRVLVCPWPIHNNPLLAGLTPSHAVRRLFRCLFVSVDVALRVLVCPWPIYNNPLLAGLTPSRAVRRLYRCLFVSVDVALRVLVCPWPIYNNPPLAGLIPSRAVWCLLPLPLALFDVALRVLVCLWPFYNNFPLAGLIPSRAVSRFLPFLFAFVLSVMDGGCAFAAFSRCLLLCILFFVFFILQSVFRVHPFVLRSCTVIHEVKALGTVF